METTKMLTALHGAASSAVNSFEGMIASRGLTEGEESGTASFIVGRQREDGRKPSVFARIALTAYPDGTWRASVESKKFELAHEGYGSLDEPAPVEELVEAIEELSIGKLYQRPNQLEELEAEFAFIYGEFLDTLARDRKHLKVRGAKTEEPVPVQEEPEDREALEEFKKSVDPNSPLGKLLLKAKS